MPYSAQLGIRLFFSLLECVTDDDCDLEERSAFLHELVPLIAELPPLSLTAYSKEKKTSSGKKAQFATKRGEGGEGNRSLPQLGILDRLRNFLYLASTTNSSHNNISSTNRALPSTSVLVSPTSHAVSPSYRSSVAQEAHAALTDRTEAATALVHLATARGSACDLLLAVKVCV